jgi:hypothetical protein
VKQRFWDRHYVVFYTLAVISWAAMFTFLGMGIHTDKSADWVPVIAFAFCAVTTTLCGRRSYVVYRQERAWRSYRSLY